MRKKLLAFLLFTVFSLSSCSNVHVNNDNLPNGNNEGELPETNLPSGNLTPSVDEEIKPTSGLVKGNPEENTLEKEEIYDADGGLKVPFDIAYPEFMGDTLYDENSLLIKIEDNKAAALPTILKDYNVDSYSFVTKSTKNLSWYKVHFEGFKSNEIINEVRKCHSFIKMVDLNYIYNESNLDYEESIPFEGEAEPKATLEIGNLNKNPLFQHQWYFENIGYAKAYDYIGNNMPQGGAGITVAVIDTGVDIYHEDLKGNIWTNVGETPNDGVDNDNNGYVDDYHGVNIVDPAIEPLDDHGHGTHVAGIVAARNNTVGTVGVAYNAKIMPIKAADATGIFSQDNIARAITYAYMNGADVINMSFGGPNSSLVVEDALKAAYTDCILVASAGNDGYVNEDFLGRPMSLPVIPNYPASLSYVLGVTSIGPNNVESAFTNIDGVAFSSQEYEVAAPGENIKSTLPNNKYGTLSGTSMSAPIISGMAAILRAYLKDQNKYPTKYIYAQIAGAASQTSGCFNPEVHGYKHNKTKIANLYEALTVMPKPDVNLYNYFIFDNKEFSSANNGDGRMDAGETIYLMPTLINRWGMSESTTITFDTKSEISQEPSRYVKILQDTINFEGVGTYSTKTLMKLSEDLTSYEGILDLNNALKFEISKDAPNGIGVPFNYVINFKNGLDYSDSIEYENDGTFNLSFNKGIVLPKIIAEDITLTSDNLYIIDQDIFIDRAATINVEAGTSIQFYSSNFDSLYKKKRRSSLLVEGKIVFNGEESNLINVFPEEKTHADFGCAINSSKNGIVCANYVKFKNLLFEEVSNNIESNTFNKCIIEYHHNYYGGVNRYSTEGKIEDLHIYSVGARFNYCLFKNTNGDFSSCYFYNCVIKSIFRENWYGPRTLHIEDNCSLINTSIVADGNGNAITIKTRFDTEFVVNDILKQSQVISSNGKNVYSIDLHSVSDINADTKLVFDLVQFLESENNKLIHTNKKYISLNNSGRLSHVEYIKIEKPESSNYYNIFSFDTNEYLGEYYSEKDIDVSKKYLCRIFWFQNDIGECYNSLEILDSITHCYSNDILRLMIESNLSLLELKKDVFKFVNTYYSLDKQSNSSINIISDYDSMIPNVEISCNGYDNNNNYFYEIDDSFLNLNINNKDIIDEVIADGHDSINRPTLVDKGTEKTWLKDCWPYVTKMELKDKNGVQKDTFNNEPLNCRLYFNREMDMNVPLRVRFGSSLPYAEYEIPGKWIDPYTWEGTYTLNTTIENGTQRFSIEGGAAADDSFLTVQECGSRFKFNIDTTAAQAMLIQGNPTRDGIELTWMQDDYDTLLGYNIYRSETKDGDYTRVNKSVISKDEESFLDTTVEPGKSYWYTFTVVFSDLSESKPAGKSSCTAFDTMNPNIYHSPVYQGYTNNDLMINCTITDNISVKEAKLHYRKKGETEYKTVDMNKNNDRYSAKIPSKDIGIEGIEYYISATDGTNTITNGSDTNPYEVVIKDNATISEKGDVDGDGIITVKDATMILKHIGGEMILSNDEFKRADLNGNNNLETNEALKILQYINGVITSLS